MLVKKLLKTPGTQFDFKHGTENSVTKYEKQLMIISFG